jgi:hypothetical protein
MQSRLFVFCQSGLAVELSITRSAPRYGAVVHDIVSRRFAVLPLCPLTAEFLIVLAKPVFLAEFLARGAGVLLECFVTGEVLAGRGTFVRLRLGGECFLHVEISCVLDRLDSIEKVVD